jgi:hypothetical protein
LYPNTHTHQKKPQETAKVIETINNSCEVLFQARTNSLLRIISKQKKLSRGLTAKMQFASQERTSLFLFRVFTRNAKHKKAAALRNSLIAIV